MDLRLALPLTGLEGRAGCGTAFTSVAFVCSQMSGLHGVILPALGHYRQGLLSGLGGAKTCGLEVQELLCDGVVFALLGLLQRGLRTFQSRLCIHH
jgi:hypothetical protein